MADWQRIGRNNKNRGRAFERKVADALGWTRVPYSGGSGEWGEGDVVDGFYKRHGLWLAECKTQPATTGNISVKHKWVEKLLKVQGRHPILIAGLTGQIPAFVFLPADSWAFLERWVSRHGGPVILEHDLHLSTKTTSRGLGFCVRNLWFASMYRNAREIALVEVEDREGRYTIWHMVTLKLFAELVQTYGCMVEDNPPEGI